VAAPVTFSSSKSRNRRFPWHHDNQIKNAPLCAMHFVRVATVWKPRLCLIAKQMCWLKARLSRNKQTKSSISYF